MRPPGGYSLMLALCLLGTACSSSNNSGADANTEAGASDASVDADRGGRMLRVYLRREMGTVRIAEAEVIDMPRTPSMPGQGPYGLVAWRGGAPVQVLPFGFPTRGIVEGVLDDGTRTREDLDLTDDTQTVLLLDATTPLERIQVLGSDGSTLAERSMLPSQPGQDAGLPEAGRPVLATEGTGPLVDHPNLFYLQPLGQHYLPLALQARIETLLAWEDLSPAQQARVRSALRLVSPAVLDATNFFAVATFPNGGVTMDGTSVSSVTGLASQGSFVLNAQALYAMPITPAYGGRAAELTIVHELAHNYSWLLQNADGYSTVTWSDSLQRLARETRQRSPLTIGFEDTWGRLHGTAHEQGLAGAYLGDNWPSRTPAQATVDGFAERYGGQDAFEDIAMYVETVRSVPASDTPSPQCMRLRAAGMPNPPLLLVPWLKINFLQRAGFLEQSDVDACMGSFRMPSRGQGIHFLGSDLTPRLDCTMNVRAGYMALGGTDMLLVSAECPNTYTALVQVRAPMRRPSLGFYNVESFNASNLNDPLNGLLLSNSNDYLSRVSASGMLVVSDVTTSRVEGLLLMLDLQNTVGIDTDHFTLVPFLYQQ